MTEQNKAKAEWGERVKRLREQAGYTISELALMAGLHPSHVAQIERGERPNPRSETVTKLCRVLHCTPEYLMYGAEPAAVDDEFLARYKEVVYFAAENGITPAALMNLVKSAIALR